MEKSYRIYTNISNDTLLNVNMKQDFDFLEILSLKLRQKDAYRLHSSNYGVIVGRVLANDAFGVPNAKISLFIERDIEDSNEVKDIYPYSDTTSKDKNSIRYNLLPDYSDDSCYRVVGTFPRKRYMLDDDMQLEVYDKYWKYTTVTNQAGDYMIFGVPEGGQQIHVDIDLSDIGILSQRPRDFVFKGHNVDEFDSPSQFKESTNLDGLQQIISQNKTTNVYPFWGDPENGIAAITRCDIQVNYKFEPTCVFMGSIVSDNDGNAIGHRCAPDEDSGINSQLVAGEGTIEMIRKTQDGLVEEFPIKGNALIDSDGVWCYQIPMNLDYVGTDEYGNIIPTDNPSKGIPTRTQVRFRISKRETGDEGVSRHTAKYLVPMNPIMDEEHVVPTTQATTGIEMEKMYNFGSNTPQNCFRDLYWNNVYSVKNYLPKVQVASRAWSSNYGGLKGSNLVDNQNPIPFNKLQIDMPFSYMIICILFTVVMIIVHFINMLIWIIQEIRGLCIGFKIFGKRIEICPFKIVIPKMGCIPLNAGLSDGSNVAFYPGCHCPDSEACKNADCPEGMEGRCRKSSDNHLLKDRIQQALALDYRVVRLDMYQDWINGTLYMPLWFWMKRKKKTFLFFTISGAKNEFCDCDKEYSRLKTDVTCNIYYKDNSLGTDDRNTDDSQERWHKKATGKVMYRNGLIKGVENKDGLTAYYYAAYQATTDNLVQLPIDKRTLPFKFARLYSTDIILIGNLNEDNLYGIPQLFKSLPSTTANLPPIATIEESIEEDESKDADTVISETEDSGTTITTGMDWGYYGGDQTPVFKTGLFVDLTCTYAGTRAKSCINVERLSELGVSLDTTYSMSYAHNSSGIKKGMIDSDGFINKFELSGMDARATFATLNHIGFIPQDYQDSIGGYTTQIQDDNTGYLVPKFKYIYPVDFDGRLQPIMDRYKKDFEQALYDEQDESYITFRLGAEKDGEKGRIRHFYYDGNLGYSMPLYNNSFYFYFGINKGNTAIDKFNRLFFSPCFQRSKAPFSFDIVSMGRSYCPNTYREKETAYNGYAYIRFTSDDIITPFSYKLYDAFSNVVISEDNMMDTDFVIGGVLTLDGENTSITMNPLGIVKYHNGEVGEEPLPVDNVYGENGLTNQMYTLEITDANGRKLNTRVELKTPMVSIEYDVESLKTRFYSTGSTRMDYICNDRDNFYGLIRIKSFGIDGLVFYVTDATVMSYDSEIDAYKIELNGASLEENNNRAIANKTSILVKVSAMNSYNVGWVRDCMCDTGNTVYSVNGEGSHIEAATGNKWWFANNPPKEDEEARSGDTEEGTVFNVIPTMYVYQPNKFVFTVTQLCDGKELSSNTISEIVNVANGANFNTFLNDMPVKFMIGTTTDSSAATVANNSKFYRSDVVEDPVDSHISGWYGLHQEDSYMWGMSENQVLKRNEDMWSDFVSFGSDITRHEAKGKVLEFKFNSIFSLSSVGYVVGDQTPFYYEAKGGVPPTLYRSVIPKYASLNAMKYTYVLSDSNMASGQYMYPQIVGNNYAFIDDDDDLIRHEEPGPNFNKYYTGDNYKCVGNYFAAFTNNGGYSSRTAVDSSASVMKIPTNSKVTPMEGDPPPPKRLGRNTEGAIEMFGPAYNKDSKYQPYLRALFVDRRLDYNLVLIAPCVSNNATNLYKVTYGEDEKTILDKREKVWRSARVSGTTYNGVEMSYDRDYNIISADTNDDGTIATPNKRLEYSYNYSDVDEDAKTYYNSEKDMIWEEDAYGVQKMAENPETHKMEPVYDEGGNPVYEEGKEPKDGQIIKRFYSATFVGSDIRNFFWSNFNRKRLNEYASDETVNSETDYNYVFKYPYTSTTLYNGDFNRFNVTSMKEYPTKRFIDVGNIPSNKSYDLEILNCAYTMPAHLLEDGTIESETDYTEGITASLSFSSPIRFVAPNAATDDYSNVLYNVMLTKVNGYAKFVASNITMTFSINQAYNDDFDVYTAQPVIIKVMPYNTDDGYDGISHIKTITPDKGGIYNAIGDVTLHKFESLSADPWAVFGQNGSIWALLSGNFDTLVIDGVQCDRMRFNDGTESQSLFYQTEEDGRFVTSDDQNFQSIKFHKSFNVSDTNMFAICVERLYMYNEETNLNRKISTFEFSEIYDARPIYLQVKTDDAESGTDLKYTYIEKKLASSSRQPGGQDEEGYTFVQTITFEMYFPYKDDPSEKACEAFANAKSMSYTLKVANRQEDIFSIAASDVGTYKPEGSNDNYVTITFKWPQDMGKLADEEWRGSTRCEIIAKTGSNFIYNTGWFNLSGIEQVEGEGEVGTKFRTKANI